MDFYSLLTDQGHDLTLVRIQQQLNPTGGHVERQLQTEIIWGCEIPPTVNLRSMKTEYAEVHTFILVDAVRYEELELYPLTIDDHIILNKQAYFATNISNADGYTLMALMRVVGQLPYNIEEVVAVC